MKVLKYAFIILESVLYVSFMSLDATNSVPLTSAWIKYSGIILCFVYVLLNLIYQYISGNKKGSPIHSMESTDQNTFWSSDSILLLLGLFFTVLSDYNLLLTNHYTAGVFFFCIVQTLYMVRIALYFVTFKDGIIPTSCKGDNLDSTRPIVRGRRSVYHVERTSRNSVNIYQSTLKSSVISKIVERFAIHAAVIIMVLVLLTICKVEVNLLLVLTCFYFMSLALNVIFAFRNRTFSGSSRLFSYGLILFICCDINVGIFNLADFVNVGGEVYETLYRLSTLGMWFFYLPSQVLIALSCSGVSRYMGNLFKNQELHTR